MAQTANSEFWRELKPIAQKFRPGEPSGTFDVFDYIALCREHYSKNGIGADYIDRLFR